MVFGNQLHGKHIYGKIKHNRFYRKGALRLFENR